MNPEFYQGFNLRWLLSVIIPVACGFVLMRGGDPTWAERGYGLITGALISAGLGANQTAFNKQ